MSKRSKGKEQSHPPKQPQSQGSNEATKRHVYIESGFQVDIVESLKQQRERERTEDKSGHDKQLLWTQFGAVLIFVYTLVSIFQLCVSRQQMQLSVRPYVGIADDVNAVTSGPITIDEHGNMRVQWVVSSRNYSNFAAPNVQISGEPVPIGADVSADYLFAKEKEDCSDKYVGHGTMGYTLFPGNTRWKEGADSTIPKAQILPSKSDGSVYVFFVGCIGYRDQFHSLYHTGFIYWYTNGKTPVEPLEFIPTPGAQLTGGAWMAWLGGGAKFD